MLSQLKKVGSYLGRLFGGWRRNGKATRRYFMANQARLSLEALEDRTAPVTITWTGNAANDLWTTPQNWDQLREPVATDDILFKDNTQDNSICNINFMQPVKSLTIEGYTARITFNVPMFNVTTMVQTSGTITGNGLFQVVNGAVNGSYLWLGGFIGNNTPGDAFVVKIMPNATMTIWSSGTNTIDSAVIDLYGTANWNGAGNITADNGSTFFVRQGGVFNASGGVGTFRNLLGGVNVFQVWSGGTYNEINSGHHTFEVDVVVNGTWNVTAGQSTFNVKSTVSGASINITQFGGLNLKKHASPIFATSEHFWSNTTITGLGWVRMEGTGPAPDVTLSITGLVTVPKLQQKDSFVTGTGNLTITSEYVMEEDAVWSGGGTVTINPIATLSMVMSFWNPVVFDRHLTNNGIADLNCWSLTWASGKNIINNGTMNITKGLNLDPAAGGGAAATITNNGTLNVEVPGLDVVRVRLPFTNAGNLNLKLGATEFTLAVTQTGGSTNLLGGSLWSFQQYNIQAGTLTGVGTITALELRNNGLVTPGNAQSPYGDLTIEAIAAVPGSGRYVQTNQGTLRVSLGGLGAANYTQLFVAGQASLAGVLSVVGPYNPQAGDAFDLMTFASLDPNANRFTTEPQGWTTSYPNGTGVRIVKD